MHFGLSTDTCSSTAQIGQSMGTRNVSTMPGTLGGFVEVQIGFNWLPLAVTCSHCAIDMGGFWQYRSESERTR